jgi:hypothetical protein
MQRKGLKDGRHCSTWSAPKKKLDCETLTKPFFGARPQINTKKKVCSVPIRMTIDNYEAISCFPQCIVILLRRCTIDNSTFGHACRVGWPKEVLGMWGCCVSLFNGLRVLSSTHQFGLLLTVNTTSVYSRSPKRGTASTREIHIR